MSSVNHNPAERECIDCGQRLNTYQRQNARMLCDDHDPLYGGTRMPRNKVKTPDSTPFAKMPVNLVRDPAVSMQAKAMYALIRSFAKNDGSGAFPSLSTLVEYTGATRQTVTRWRDELVDAGWLRVTKQKRGDEWLSSTYDCYDHPRKGGRGR